MILKANKHYRGPSAGTVTWVVGHINMRVGAIMATMIPGSWMRGEDLVNVRAEGLGIPYTEDEAPVHRAVSDVHARAEGYLMQQATDAILRGD